MQVFLITLGLTYVDLLPRSPGQQLTSSEDHALGSHSCLTAVTVLTGLYHGADSLREVNSSLVALSELAQVS